MSEPQSLEDLLNEHLTGPENYTFSCGCLKVVDGVLMQGLMLGRADYVKHVAEAIKDSEWLMDHEQKLLTAGRERR